jgi:hypothetical protein
MYDADIQSMDAAAKGAKVGCHHQHWFVYDAYDVKCERRRNLEWGLYAWLLHK